ncbi:PhzF family phenazine biosynthesis protein [Cryobacterium sp. MDB1-18-2]|uniref:PhzF family phenazine biosynthesis protein n=1 Tax=unclassified Cryobacterium TaxID=2649013 RepID=UPI00106A0542|nr:MULTISPECIES: PhzF family phenazine biosynthesis protein [unclassified Cryobacterium]TFC33751.1 PhzF family phenazine biosynthesis protein [Cryobacterium sp. MDB1-18-2]TFC40723.1 PhzF family phenazine biosynthesis protein [Cryobacterium sp. MDB1-18-1]
MFDETEILRLTAFAAEPTGGNPAGVVLDASTLPDAEMQRIAAALGYAETAFLTRPPTPQDPGRAGIRYFSPTAEVPFCGHATIATAVALAGRGDAESFVFETKIGEVRIATRRTADGIVASFTSVEPRVEPIGASVLEHLLRLLGVDTADLHPDYPPRLAFAGNVHPVLVFAETATFDGFRFDPAQVRALMDAEGWAGTVTTLRVLGPLEFEARNLFPVGTMTEDPATGSAAASVGGYLRALGLVDAPARVLIHQGRHVGRPSLLTVDIPETGGIVVSGTASVIS